MKIEGILIWCIEMRFCIILNFCQIAKICQIFIGIFMKYFYGLMIKNTYITMIKPYKKTTATINQSPYFLAQV